MLFHGIAKEYVVTIVAKGLARLIKHENRGPLAAFSLTSIHSLTLSNIV